MIVHGVRSQNALEVAFANEFCLQGRSDLTRPHQIQRREVGRTPHQIQRREVEGGSQRPQLQDFQRLREQEPTEGYALIAAGKHTCARYAWIRNILPCQSVNPSVLFGVAATDDKGAAETPTKGTQLDEGDLEVRWGSVVWYG